MKIELDTLVEMIVRETVNELARLGIEVEDAAGAVPGHASPPPRAVASPALQAPQRVAIDLSQYRTPVLLERHITALDRGVLEIEIPDGTVIAPGARDAIKHRKLRVIGECSVRRANH